jgi:hypothetical protein
LTVPYKKAVINEEKEKSSKEYFEKLISGKGNSAPSHAEGGVSQQKLTPIEEIFHNYMKKSLLNYNEYYLVLLRS